MATQTESTKFVLERDKEYKEKLESTSLQYSDARSVSWISARVKNLYVVEGETISFLMV